ncbi:bacterio-opsin activator domain-containing protein [Halobellus rubicundus]|uniref:Bacterio-opsin activator domain-containing protein n=1 Tax=Halobellus rubicundus TaxID=2996466 RepID=A0ABD5ME64_9EURY
MDPPAASEYRRLRRATETHREDLVLRLGGEVGLRPGEMTRVRLADVESHDGTHFLAVRDADGDVARDAYLPAGVEHDLRKYAGSVGAGEDDPLLTVSPRRLQMLVGEVADRVDGVDASSRDLRWHFAAELIDDGVPPRVVCALGGWRLERLAPLLSDPDREAVAAALDGAATALDGLGRDVALAADLGAELLGVATVDETARTACACLADAEGVRFAWLAERTGEAFAVREAVGVDAAAAETALDGYDPDARARDERDVRVRESERGPLALVPVRRDDTRWGVLGIGVRRPVGDARRDALAVLGTQVGHALAAVQRKRLLLADTVVELDFRCPAASSFVADLSGALDCRVELSGAVPVGDGSLLYYLVTRGAGADPVLSHADAADAVADTRLIEDYGDGAAVEVVVTDAPALALVDRGARVRSLVAEDGAATLTGEIPGDADVRAAVDAVTDAYPGVSLSAKRQEDRPVETDVGFRERLADRLSDRQATVLRAAYHSGYFEWPRGSTAEELADSLEVSSPTLHNHLRKAQQKLLTAFFDDAAPRSEL